MLIYSNGLNTENLYMIANATITKYCIWQFYALDPWSIGPGFNSQQWYIRGASDKSRKFLLAKITLNVWQNKNRIYPQLSNGSVPSLSKTCQCWCLRVWKPESGRAYFVGELIWCTSAGVWHSVLSCQSLFPQALKLTFLKLFGGLMYYTL